eukprot:354096-Chlamydomonas_euryale.AAC.7
MATCVDGGMVGAASQGRPRVEGGMVGAASQGRPCVEGGTVGAASQGRPYVEGGMVGAASQGRPCVDRGAGSAASQGRPRVEGREGERGGDQRHIAFSCGRFLEGVVIAAPAVDPAAICCIHKDMQPSRHAHALACLL